MVVFGGIKRQMVLSRISTIKGHEQIMKQGYDDVIAVGKRMVEFFFYPHKQTLVRIGIDVEIYTTFRFAERNLCKFLGGDSLISCNKCTNN